MVWFNNPFLIELKVDKNLSIFAINYILGKKTISITLMEFYISNGNTAVSDAQMWSIFVDSAGKRETWVSSCWGQESGGGSKYRGVKPVDIGSVATGFRVG